MSDCRKCADFEWCKEHEECGLFKQKQMTNADRIRSMTDEELAYFIASDYYVPHCPIEGECLDDHDGCDGCWLVWLKQESGGK